MSKPEKALLTLSELSTYLGLSNHAVRWHVRCGRIRPVRLGRRLFFQADEVLEDLKRKSTPQPKRAWQLLPRSPLR